MKQLYLIRHAKSSWSDPSLADFDRPLNKRGKRDAPFMGKRLASLGICPELMVSSPAKRARKTAGIIAKQMGYDTGNIKFFDEIYTSDLMRLLAVIQKTDQAVNSLALVGHNYVLTEIAEWLTDKTLVNVPTAGIVSIQFTIDNWEQVGQGEGTLVFFDYPKLHGDRSPDV